jgi:hypothetical protein
MRLNGEREREATYDADIAAQFHSHDVPFDRLDGGDLALVGTLDDDDAVTRGYTQVL